MPLRVTPRLGLIPRAAALALLLASAGCAGGLVPPPYPPDTARLQPGTFATNEDPDVAAINFAQYAFADPGRTYGRPADGARAVASVDYLAGELTTSPRWADMGPLTKQQMLQARQQVRAVVGIRPDARSQAVVDSMVAVAAAMSPNGGGQPAALAALQSPIFTAPPDQIFARLANLPYIQLANVASQKAANEMFGPGNTFWND